MKTSIVLWRMTHRNGNVEVIGELHDGRIRITIDGDEMRFDNHPRFVKALEAAPRHLHQSDFFHLLMTKIPQACAELGFRTEDQ